MARIRRAGGWLLIAALSTAPSTGCKSGFSFPIWNPFAKSSGGTILERDSSGGYIQPPTTSMPEPAPPVPRAEEFGWTAPLKKLGDTVSAPFKKTATPKKPKSVAEVELARKDAPPGPELYVTLAQMQEKAGRDETAVAEYEKALEINPKHLPALLGLARLYDRGAQYDKALAIYKKAVEAHPESAAAFNDMGLCYVRGGRMPDAVLALQRAVALDGDKPLYRNNLATVLVEVGRSDEAYRVLVKAHGEAIAHYNVGYLLNKRGQRQRALEEFRLAAKADPNLSQAKQWIEVLSAGEKEATPQDTLAASPKPAALPKAPAQPLEAAESVATDPNLETPIASPIVVPGRNEPRIAPISQPRIVEDPAPLDVRPLPQPADEATDESREASVPRLPVDEEAAPPAEPMPTPLPATVPTTDDSGPKLLGNEQARRNAPRPATAGDRYYVGDRYSTAAPTAGSSAPIAATPPAARSVPAKAAVAPLPAAEKSVPTTAGARYPASRY